MRPRRNTMPRSRTNGTPRKPRPLSVRLDDESKDILSRAARLRAVTVDEYIRAVAVPQAQREVEAAAGGTIALAPEEQLAFWTALSEPAKLTPNQKKLGALMRGGS